MRWIKHLTYSEWVSAILGLCGVVLAVGGSLELALLCLTNSMMWGLMAGEESRFRVLKASYDELMSAAMDLVNEHNQLRHKMDSIMDENLRITSENVELKEKLYDYEHEK